MFVDYGGLSVYRLWWVVAITISLSLCIFSIRNVWIDWRNRPVTMTYSEKEESISTIPFPTVTVCPRTKFLKDKFKFDNDLYHAYMANPNTLSDIE